MNEIKVLFEIVALIVGTLGCVIVAGWWFGSRHQVLISAIAELKEMFTTHVDEEGKAFKRIEDRVKRIEGLINGSVRG